MQPGNVEPDFIPKDCLRLNSPYMLQPEKRRTVSPTEVEKATHILRPFDPSHHFNHLTASLEQNDSCEWIEDEPVFTQWLAPTHGQLRLQISGAPKTRKTSSALFVVDHLQHLQSSRSSKTQVLYFFCHRPYRQRSTASAVLNGWIYQLIQQRPDMMDDFCGWLFHDPRFLPNYLNQATIMWTFLRRAAKRTDAGITYCVLDGLDECDEESRSLILELLTRTLPYEGCPEAEPTLKILVTTRTPLDDARFANIDLTAHAESESLSHDLKSLTIEEHSHSPSYKANALSIMTLELLAVYFCPPTTEQFLSFFIEKQRPAVLAFLDSAPTQLLVSPERIEFMDTDAWLTCSKSKLAKSFHKRLARQCLEVISAGLTQIDMADLENNDEFVWQSQIPADQKYAVNYWADHVRLSLDTSQELMELILKTFGPDSATLEKWWIMFMTWNYGISQYHDPRHHNTTCLHLFALFGLDKILLASRPGWLLDRQYVKSEDAQGLEPLDLAILHNHFETANALAASCEHTETQQCIFATASSVPLADLVFSRHTPHVQNLEKHHIDAMLWNACYIQKLDLLNETINFIFKKSPGSLFPWDDTTHAENIIDDGEHQLLLPILTLTNMKEKARHIIEYATAQHEPYILEEILRHEVVANMIKGKQIDLRRALNTALERRSARMSAWLLNEDTMDVSNDVDRRPLEFAVKHPNIHTLMLFLAQPNFTFDKGTIEEGVALNLMLHKAYTEVSIDSLGQMLKHGARMRYEHFGMTALHVAAEIGQMPVMETLVDNLTEEEIQNDIDLTCSGAHRDQGRDGKTALAIAAMRGRFEMVGYLLSKGADIEVEDAQGKTAVDLAREAGWGDLMGILEEIEQGLEGEGTRGTMSEGRGEEKKVWKCKGKMRADV